MDLKSRLTIRVALVIPFLAALLFAPAGSLYFWQGWGFLSIFAGFSAVFGIYFYRRDPKLLERRLRDREPRPEQKQIKMLWVSLWLCTLALPGLDHRLGWSAVRFGGVPVFLSGAAFVAVIIAWILVFHVMRFNTFASAVVQVEAGQKVVTDGPYAIVRHPMYAGFALLILATPFALGSYVAIVPALLLMPVLVLRLRDEERALRRGLSGYAEYCGRTRYRMIPFVF
jgi:protein-S-isoprenylcysteine O-methyltransferase Ste14